MELPQLLKACAKHQLMAQKQLFDLYARQMYILCRRYMRSNETAEEAMMNGFYKFFTSLHKFTYASEAATTAWIKKMMVNECLALLRKKEHLMMVSEAEAEDIADHPVVLDDLQAEEIYLLVTRLPIGYRTVFNLYAIEGLGHKEIATLLNITEGTSKSQLSKARQWLQKMILEQNKETHAGR
jgi:RNA polymerase sigma-70 factor (ECF subfamily)